MSIDPRNQIATFFHCKACIEQLPKGVSPAGFQRIEVGWTPFGVQVWCRRHDKNIMHLDFGGTKVNQVGMQKRVETDAPRWQAVVNYRSADGINPVTYDFNEIWQLHPLIERGPSFAAVEVIEVRYQLGDGTTTVEQESKA